MKFEVELTHSAKKNYFKRKKNSPVGLFFLFFYFVMWYTDHKGKVEYAKGGFSYVEGYVKRIY